MRSFTYYNPIKIIFGVNKIAELKKNVPIDANLMLLYGGGSVKKNGVFEQVMKALEEHKGKIIEFGGIEPNPEYVTAMKAVELGKKENIDYLLAIGGGSVADCTKFISVALKYEGECAYEMLEKPRTIPKDKVHFGIVITLPATASEFNQGGVISWAEKGKKIGSRLSWPDFSIIDPSTTLSLPIDQIHNGICDAFVHVVEQYVTFPTDSKLQDRHAEGLLLTLIEETDRLHANPENVDIRANIFWCASNALNYFLAAGVASDWSTHMIGHELTSIHHTDHAKTLSILLPGVWRKQRKQKREKLIQYASRVWGITSTGEDDEDSIVEQAIVKTEEFFHEKLKLPIRLSHVGLDAEQAKTTADKIGAKFREDGKVLGERKDMDHQVVHDIVMMQS